MAGNWGRKSRNFSDVSSSETPAATGRGVFSQLRKADRTSDAAGKLAERISRAMNTANEKTNFIPREPGNPNAKK